ncbi:MAG: hypothetical protein Q6K55_07130 [Thermostichus sp. DG02_3_bins_51]
MENTKQKHQSLSWILEKKNDPGKYKENIELDEAVRKVHLITFADGFEELLLVSRINRVQVILLTVVREKCRTKMKDTAVKGQPTAWAKRV